MKLPSAKRAQLKEEDGYSYQWEYDEMNHLVKAIDKESRETLFELNITSCGIYARRQLPMKQWQNISIISQGD